MGYTHYWYRKDKEIGFDSFNKIVSDFRSLIPHFSHLGIDLAGGDGRGEAVIEADLVNFNGPEDCGHPERHELGITWPSDNATGIANPWAEDVSSKPWFAGATIDKRTCSGDCSHESLRFTRVISKDEYGYFASHPTKDGGKGWQFDFCKTAYKPYDVAVTAFLIIAKHYLNRSIWISSDGETQHWADARILCQKYLGHGVGFELDRES